MSENAIARLTLKIVCEAGYTTIPANTHAHLSCSYSESLNSEVIQHVAKTNDKWTIS